MVSLPLSPAPAEFDLVPHRTVALSSGNIAIMARDGRGWSIVDGDHFEALRNWLTSLDAKTVVAQGDSGELGALWQGGLLSVRGKRNPRSVPKARTNPSVVLVKLTGACNYGCTYCYDYDEDRFRARLPVERVMGVISDVLSRQEQLSLVFHGGEPLLRFAALEEIVRSTLEIAGNSKRVTFSIQTNGSLLNSETISFLDANQFSVGLSIDGLSEYSNRHRIAPRRQGALDVFNNLQRNFSEFLVQRCGVFGVVSQSSRPTLTELVLTLQQIGIRAFSFSFLDRSGRAANLADEMLSPEEAVDTYRELFRLIREGELANIKVGNIVSYIDNLFDFQPRDLCNKGPCGASGEFLVIDAEGKLRSCDVLYDPFFEATDKHGTATEAGASAARARVRDRHDWLGASGPHCSRCPYFALCGGTCVAKAIANAGDEKAVDPITCAVTRYVYRELLEELDLFDKAGPLVGYYLRHRSRNELVPSTPEYVH